jgi:outer membrane protein
MRLRRAIPILLFLFGGAITGRAAEVAGGPVSTRATQYMSLKECIQVALLRNREIQIERMNPMVARLALSASHSYYDPILSAEGRRENTADNGGFDPSDFSRDAVYSAESYVSSIGITGQLPTGMTYSVDGNYAASRGQRNGLNFESYEALAGLAVRQPLLKNFWIDEGRMAMRINKRNLKITEFGVAWLTMDVINRIQQAYYELLFARGNLAIQLQLLEAKRQMLGATRRKIEQGFLTSADEQLAQARLAMVETALIGASNVTMLAENSLKALMGDDFRTRIQLVPSDPLLAVPEPFDYYESRRLSLIHRPDLAQLREDVQKANIDMNFRRNQLFPSLDIVAGYGRRGSDVSQVPPPFRADASPTVAFNQIGQGSAPNDMVGLVFSVPLSRRAERAN